MFSTAVSSSVLVLTGAVALLAGCGSDPTATSTPPTSTIAVTTTTAAGAPTTATTKPVEAVEIANGDQQEPIAVAVDGGAAGVDVTFRRITLAPGAGTGEHCHYGQLVAVVAEGELTHRAPIYPGGVHVYRAGDSLIEGPGYRHEGTNEGSTPTVLVVTYLTPEGKPLAETDLTHCDD